VQAKGSAAGAEEQEEPRERLRVFDLVQPRRKLAHGPPHELDCLIGLCARFAALDALRDLVARALPGNVVPNDAVTSLVTALRGRARPSPAGKAGASVEDRAPAPPEPPRSPSRPPRVLLIEDSPTVRMLATMQLSDAGLQVEAVADGAQALVRALEEEYELVVASVDMRGIGGLDLAAALRGSRSRSHLPIVLMSSDEDPEERRRAADIGVDGYVRKGSFDQPWLAVIVQRVIGRGAA
jgi:CheY-like chemotaxis protein